jgi:hypothetical protein
MPLDLRVGVLKKSKGILRLIGILAPAVLNLR